MVLIIDKTVMEINFEPSSLELKPPMDPKSTTEQYKHNKRRNRKKYSGRSNNYASDN